jgi:hypothetical protein
MLGVLLHAPRDTFYRHKGLGAVEVPFGRRWLPSVCGCTRLYGGALDCHYATTIESPDWLSSFLGRALDCPMTLPDHSLLMWPTLIVRPTVGIGEESLLVWRN